MLRSVAIVSVAALVVLSGCGGDDSDAEELMVGTPVPTNGEIRDCLLAEGFEAQLLKAPPGDPDTPTHELNFIRGAAETGGQLALYESESEAQRLLPEVEENVADAGGSVEQDGSITLVWFAAEPDSEIRDDVVGCLS